MNSEIQFKMESSDHPGQLRWSFTDSSDKVSIYDVDISQSLSPVSYALRLNDFSNPGGFDWTQIKSIEISGGGVAEWDFTFSGGVIVSTPEASAFSILATGFGVGLTRIRKRKFR